MARLSVRLIPLLLALLLLSGCAGVRSYVDDPQLAGRPQCASLLATMEQRIRTHGVADALGSPLIDYPYLRSNRWLASFSGELHSDAQFYSWYRQLAWLGQQARGYELDNLPADARFSPNQRSLIETCLAHLAERDARAPGYRQRLLAAAQVDDAYNDGLRILGLFPLTRQLVLYKVNAAQREWRRRFNAPAQRHGPSRLYRPAGEDGLATQSPPAGEPAGQLMAAQIAAHPLAWPLLPPADLARLFAEHAPQWQLFTHSPADRIGFPSWRDGELQVDTQDPVTFLLPSFTRFAGQTLLQLNYLIWFPERPVQGGWDIYAGKLDGVIWRVTLNPDGSVLLYDSIHACGCYHLVFPVDPRLRAKPLSSQTEAPLILTEVLPSREARLRLQLTPSEHFLMGIQVALPEGETYRRVSYHALRSLPTGQGQRRSLFGADGLIRASQRPERWLLWPMGVPSAGAQRIWGQHAVSFANKRHFDDAFLFEELFEELLETPLAREPAGAESAPPLGAQP